MQDVHLSGSNPAPHMIVGKEKMMVPAENIPLTPFPLVKNFKWENCIEILSGSLNSEPIDRKLWTAHFEFYGPPKPIH